MFACKSFIKRKRRILKSLQVPDLLDDMNCGSAICTNCTDKSTCLEAFPTSFSDVYPKPHYIIPDVNVCIHHFDVLEAGFKNTIILQTAIEELQHHNSTAYNRAAELVTNVDCHFYAFMNEDYRYTYTERIPGESYIDRNDRAIRNAVKFYQEHLKLSAGSDIDVVLLTNDKETSERAKEEGLAAYTFVEYVKGMMQFPSLIEQLENDMNTKENELELLVNKTKYKYPKLLKILQIQEGLMAGSLLQGKFQACRENYLEGFVCVRGEDEFNSELVFIQGSNNINRAIHNDLVAIEILPEDKWTYPSSLVLGNKRKTPDIEKEQNKEEIIKKEFTHRCAKIVGIILSYERLYCGMLQPLSIKSESSEYFFAAENKLIPRILVHSEQGNSLLKQKIIVSIDSWPRDSKYPKGHFVQTLDDAERIIEEKLLIMIPEYQVDDFSTSALECIPRSPLVITEKEVAERKDYRNYCTFSVDSSSNCIYIDDAVHCKQLENGRVEIGIHIADVSNFIRPGTQLDQEVYKRAVSVYARNRLVEMIPEDLGLNFCSLREKEDRFGFSLILEIDENGVINSENFYKSVINLKAALSFADAIKIINNRSLDDELARSLRMLSSITSLLKQKRINKEGSFSMIEELMLLANMSAAKLIKKAFPDSALLRTKQKTPNFEPLFKAGLIKGFHIDRSKQEDLNSWVETASSTEDSKYNRMLRLIYTSCTPQSLYIRTGCLGKEEDTHFGLGVPSYTHFTSPLRRYSDVIVHRQIAAAIGADTKHPSFVDQKEITAACQHLNTKFAVAGLYKTIFQNKNTFSGYILKIHEKEMEVVLPKLGMECRIDFKSLKGKDGQSVFTYVKEGPTLSQGSLILNEFDEIGFETENIPAEFQPEKISLKLVKRAIPGFSVPLPTQEPPIKKKKTK